MKEGKKRVVVGLSGGVDSSVAAYLLLQQGYEVIGMFMRNWHDDSVTINNECPWIEDSNDALIISEQLGIPFQTIDLSEQYKQRIVDYMFDEYSKGRTPNPDVLCNREIKFDVFLEAAMSLGADYVATGHYCRKDATEMNGKTIYRLLSGKDNNKDQSYFLCQLSQEQLSKTLFPIGELQKSEVRAIAKKMNLTTADKKDSQGLCFVGKVKLPDFLKQKLQPKKGDVIEINETYPQYQENRNSLDEIVKEYTYENADHVIGEHQGAHYFTIGQRKGLGIGGTDKPLFVIGTDTDLNRVYVGCGDEHPGLYRNGLFIPHEDIHWIREDLQMTSGEERNYLLRIRYRQPLQMATLKMKDNGLYIIFEKPQRGIAKGQFATWYFEDELLGSGVIN